MILRRFADSNGLILLESRDGDQLPFKLAVRKACSEVGFYEIPTADVEESHQEGHDPEMVEKALSDIEGAANSVITEILEGDFPTTQEKRFSLALYLSLQMSRGWSFRESMNQTAQNILLLKLEASMTDDHLSDILSSDGKQPTEESIDALRRKILKNPPQISTSKSNAIQRGLDLGLHELLPHIFFRSWRILKFADPCLLTSDSPFGYWAPPHMREYGPFGVGNAPAVFFPLDRTTALSMTLKNAVERIVPSSQVRANQINYSVASEAEKWIMRHPEDLLLSSVELPPRGRFVNEFVSSRVDDDGNYRELYQMVKR